MASIAIISTRTHPVPSRQNAGTRGGRCWGFWKEGRSMDRPSMVFILLMLLPSILMDTS